jgi:hypothetical protein
VALEARREVVTAQALPSLNSACVEALFEEVVMDKAEGSLDIGRIRREVEVNEATELVELLLAEALLLNESHEGGGCGRATGCAVYEASLRRPTVMVDAGTSG